MHTSLRGQTSRDPVLVLTMEPRSGSISVSVCGCADVRCRMAQQYYEYANYKEEHVQEQKKLPKGACHSYIIVFHSVFYIIFHVSPWCLRPFQRVTGV